jgi:hypothetical protein
LVEREQVVRALKATADAYHPATDVQVVVTEREDFPLPQPR